MTRPVRINDELVVIAELVQYVRTHEAMGSKAPYCYCWVDITMVGPAQVALYESKDGSWRAVAPMRVYPEVCYESWDEAQAAARAEVDRIVGLLNG